MRWSPLPIVLPFLLLTTSTIAHPVSPSFAKLIKRTDACNGDGKNLRKPPGRSEIDPRDCLTARRELEGSGQSNTFDWANAATLAPIGVSAPFNDIKIIPKNAGLVVGKLVRNADKIVERDFTCDHILELDFVGQILRNPGGVCDQIAEEADAARRAEKEAAFDDIIVQLNSNANIAFFLSSVEELKTQYTIEFKKDQRAANFDTPPAPFPFLAFESYLDLTRTRSLSVAAKVDKVITDNFRAQDAVVTAQWTDYLKRVKLQRATALRTLNTLKSDFEKKCKAAKDAKVGPRSGVRRMVDFVLGRRQTPPAACALPKPPAKTPPTKKPPTKTPPTKKPPTKAPPAKTPPTRKPPTKTPPTKKPPTKTPPTKKPPTKKPPPKKTPAKKTTPAKGKPAKPVPKKAGRA